MSRSRLLIVLVLLFVMIRFVVSGWHEMAGNANSQGDDQGAYLQLGLELKADGTLTDGVRNPLYPAVLSPFVQRDWSYFTFAKLGSLTFGILSVIVLFVVARRLFNWKTALLASMLFGINANVIEYSAQALSETLLTLLFILAWALSVLGLRRNKLTYWALAGLLTGLAQLTKGTSQLFVVAVIVSAMLLKGIGSFRNRNLWIYLGIYCAVVLPLWGYNLVHFGSPNFNYATTNQMWMDDWRDWYNLDRSELPTALTYVRDHSIGEIVVREWEGIKDLRFVLVHTLFPHISRGSPGSDTFPVPPWALGALAIIALLVLMLARRRAVRSYWLRRQPELTLTLVLCVLFYLLFAWYTKIVSQGVRFLLPLLPMLLVILSDIVVGSVSAAFRRLSSPPLRYVLAGALGIGFVCAFWWVPQSAWGIRGALTQNVFQLDAAFGASRDYPLRWLKETAPQGTVVVQAYTHSLPAWQYSDWLTFTPPPDELDMAEFGAFLEEHHADYVLVERALFKYQHGELADYFHLPKGKSVELLGSPPGLGLMLAYPGLPFRWAIFRVLDYDRMKANLTHSCIAKGIRGAHQPMGLENLAERQDVADDVVHGQHGGLFARWGDPGS